VKLYYWPRTRAFTSLWMMEEVGEPYELVRVDLRAANHPSESYKQINPMGKLAGFQDGACAMGETAAILLYVADKFPNKRLAPQPSDPRRGRFLQWLMFPATTIEPVMVEKRAGKPPNTFQSGWGDYDRAMQALETAMQPGPWLSGGTEFTAADLYIASALNFGMRFGMIDQRPAFAAFVARAVARPAFEHASAIEAREAALAYPAS
jgi:glutathione S-transferase